MTAPHWARVVVYSGNPEDTRGVCRALEEASAADVLIKASGVGVFDELLDRAILEVRAADAQVIFWDVDAPATLDRLAFAPRDPFHAVLPRYDLVLTYGGGEPVVHGYAAAGARRCVPVYNALDPDTHYPVPANPRFAADLGFLGNRLPDREARVDEFFVRPASCQPSWSFILGGSGWEARMLPANVRYLGHVYTRDHNAFNCTPRAVLNISRDSMASYGFSPATRLFEAAGASACLLTDAWDGIERFLEPELEVLVVHDGDDVVEQLQRLDTARAIRIGQAARRRVLAEHTYARRAAQVDALLEARTTA